MGEDAKERLYEKHLFTMVAPTSRKSPHTDPMRFGNGVTATTGHLPT